MRPRILNTVWEHISRCFAHLRVAPCDLFLRLHCGRSRFGQSQDGGWKCLQRTWQHWIKYTYMYIHYFEYVSQITCISPACTCTCMYTYVHVRRNDNRVTYGHMSLAHVIIHLLYSSLSSSSSSSSRSRSRLPRLSPMASDDVISSTHNSDSIGDRCVVIVYSASSDV